MHQVNRKTKIVMNIFNLFKKGSQPEISDLTPRGVAKSIIPENHGSVKDYNDT